MKNSIFSIAVLLFFPVLAFGQTEKEPYEKEKKHTISLCIGHTQVAKGLENGKQQWLSLPSWALDYNFRFCEKWALSIQNDVILSNFEVESSEEDKVIARSTPFSSMIALGYYPVEYLEIFVAGGGEFAKEDNFALIRIGLESSLEINASLELLATVIYDYKIEGYDSFGFSLGVGYKF